jgi:hypothetical protein
MKFSEKVEKVREERNALYEQASRAKIAENEELYQHYILQVKGMNRALEILSRK